MKGQSDQAENLWATFDQDRVDFLKTELSLCFTFADVAATEIKIGEREAAEKALAYA